jgi:hypothetical protein
LHRPFVIALADQLRFQRAIDTILNDTELMLDPIAIDRFLDEAQTGCAYIGREGVENGV